MQTTLNDLNLNESLKTSFLNQSNSNWIVILNALFLIVLLLTGKANPMAIVFAYIFETVIIGVIHVMKFFLVIRYTNQPGIVEKGIANYALILFFIFHYGFFIFIQSSFLYMAFFFETNKSITINLESIRVIMSLKGFNVAMISISFIHVIELFFNFIKNKRYYHQDIKKYFSKPYLRIFIQQFVVIIPFFFMVFSSQIGLVAALLLIAIRTTIDFYLNDIGKRPRRLEKIARFLTKNKPEEYEETKESLKVFLD